MQIKRIILLILAMVLMSQPAFARKLMNIKPLTVSSVKIDDMVMSNGSAVTSDQVKVTGNVGFFALYVIEDTAGGTGDVDIYAQYSVDGTTWGRPYISDMAGTITVEGNIVTALQNATRYIQFTARPAPYVRFIFDPDADSEVTAILLYQEETN